ncbi:LytTR family two component transcriptional regulator [Thiogranum longum]|uniref:LytTR family two component transcriptional regulator n=1 Tax=Thiogranum longum TaxID=1537524 RepID=A0A4R1H541_9GAMM|nr:LytTR family DNA-binding domain-containing protein [Thiogranum longum]TCK16817.1 LytTR family two component transcriptional regulator [Thiogranum longum]
MKCLVVDDELLARERLTRMLDQLEGCEVCGEAADGQQALDQAQVLVPELILMDIRMPGMDGLEAARHLLKLDNPPAVVFTTAYGDHALEAFEAQAIDYLLKPIHPERLQQALEKARRLNLVQLENISGDSDVRTHLCARNRGNLELVPVEEVVYLQADQKYVTVRSATRKILVEDALKALEEEFGDRFLRIHRNALVAVQCIRALEKDSQGHVSVVLDGVEERLEVSRRLLPEVRRNIRNGA